METLVENNQCYITWDILKIFKSSAENHLNQLGFVNHFDACVRHKVGQKNLWTLIFPCDSLLKCNENVPCSKQIVMGNEKWILYNNVEWKSS